MLDTCCTPSHHLFPPWTATLHPRRCTTALASDPLFDVIPADWLIDQQVQGGADGGDTRATAGDPVLGNWEAALHMDIAVQDLQAQQAKKLEAMQEQIQQQMQQMQQMQQQVMQTLKQMQQAQQAMQQQQVVHTMQPPTMQMGPWPWSCPTMLTVAGQPQTAVVLQPVQIATMPQPMAAAPASGGLQIIAQGPGN